MMHIDPPEVYHDGTRIQPALITNYVVNIYAVPFKVRDIVTPIGLARSYGVAIFGGGPKHCKRAVLKELYDTWGPEQPTLIVP